LLIFLIFHVVIIKHYKVKKNYLTNFRKFPEIFRGKFPEISELTTLATALRISDYENVIRCTQEDFLLLLLNLNVMTTL